MPTLSPKILLCPVLVLGCFCDAAIIYSKAPDGGRQIVSESLTQMLAEHSNGSVLGERGLKLADVTIGEPFRTYYVGLTNLAAGKMLSAAESHSWQYLLLHESNAVGAVSLHETGGKLEFSGLYGTDFSSETLGAMRMAEQLPQIKKQDYELRRLDIPTILFAALWLHGKSDDIIIPLGLTFGRWGANQPYSESQMIKLLKPAAKKKLKEPAGMIY